jgi:hypothetical protein
LKAVLEELLVKKPQSTAGVDVHYISYPQERIDELQRVQLEMDGFVYNTTVIM